MALSPKASIQLSFPDQLKLYFQDITGLYNVSTNPGGYGTPNIAKSDVLRTDLYLTAPGSDTETLLTDFDYLPTDASPAEITCDMYDPDTEEDDDEEDECSDCPDDALITDCDDEAVTCFADGCWTLRYVVFWTDLANTPYEVEFTQFFYGLTLKRLEDMTKTVKSGTVQNEPNFDWERKLNDAWNDYQRMLLTSQLSDCDCNCVSSALSSVQKKLTEMENRL